MENNSKQRLLVEYLISSPDTFALCKSIVKSEYFDPEYRKSVDFLHTYYDKYSATPTPDQVEAETGVMLKKRDVTRDQVSYVSDEIETFCRRRAVQQAILAAPKMIAEGDYGKVEQMIKDAVTVSLHRNIGLTYFENPQERLEKMAEVPQRTSTLWNAVDELLSGGLARKEIILFSANSGGGKSITLANLALNFLAQPKYPGCPQKMDVLYISLELSEELIAQRFDTMYTGISSVVWQERHEEIGEIVSEIGPHMGRLTIKRMPSGTNANAIRAYLKEFELKNGYVPDLLVIDYLDLMGANEKVSADNVFEKDKRASEQLSDILFDYNMFGATASQQNRSAIDAQELNHSHIAGGISKVNAADWYVSIVMTPAMKSAGEMAFVFLKTRSSDGVGKTVYLKWDNNHLRIRNMSKDDDVDGDGVIASKISAFKTNPKKRSMLDSFDIDSEQ
jgi:KaiC/GvpD/RAD55 family RecA-like ATPase